MKHTLLPATMLLTISGSLVAQSVQVVDQATLRPIEGAAFTSASPPLTALSDARGMVDLGGFAGSTAITIAHVSYRPVTLTYAEAAAAGTIHLGIQVYDLAEFVTSASRFEERRRDVPEHISLIKQRSIAFLDQQTTPDLLQNSGALFVQRSQMGGGSPVIRGFEASRILLVVDGVRMNNAIYRSGHLQDIMTVDQNVLDRVEVISGPGSVVYGSDALGGVIHLMTRSPKFLADGPGRVAGDAFARTSTANEEKTVHAGFELRGSKVASYTSITASDFGHLRAGSTRNPFYEDFGRRPFYQDRVNEQDVVAINPDGNVQIGTAYKQLDLLQKLRLRTGEHLLHQLNLQFSTSSDVPRYDRLSEYTVDTAGNYVPRQAEWYYGPQKRLLAAYTLEWKRETGLFNTARLTPSHQWIEQSRHTRAWGSSRRGHNVEQVGVIAFNADLEKRIGRHELRYGAEFTHNDVESTARREHIRTGEITYRTTRYPNGGSSMTSYAAYVSHTLELNERWVISEGLRFTQVGLEAVFDDTVGYKFLNGSHAQDNGALSWRVGALFMPGHDWRISALASTGFRAPNVDDMGKVFDPAPGTVVVPNPGLKPETTTNFELGIGKTVGGRYTLELNGFHTLYNDALTVSDFTFGGQDSIDYDGTPSRVTALTNAGEAYLYGGSGQLIMELNDQFRLRSSLTYTYGRIKADTTDHPLDHIPPVYGRTGVEFQAKRIMAECYALYNGWKRLKDYNLQGEDNIQYATAEGMPAWYTLNVRASYAITRNLSLQLGLENILDMHYRTFASGVSGPGRNFQASLRAAF